MCTNQPLRESHGVAAVKMVASGTQLANVYDDGSTLSQKEDYAQYLQYAP